MKLSFYKNILFQQYACFLILTLLLYFNTRQAGFVTDFLGWQSDFDNNSAWAVINGDRYNIKSFYHFTHILMYAMSAAFRLNGTAWFLLFSSLFALNGLLVFRLFIDLFNKLEIPHSTAIASIGVLFFMLSPYQAEVMVWRASFHYLTGFAMMLSFVHLALQYVDNQQVKYWIGAIIIFFCSVFSLEFFLITPFVTLMIIVFLYLNFPKSFNLKNTIIRFVGIPLSMIGIYFVLYRLTHEKWIAHYGSKNHETLISPESFATYGKYVVKYLGFIRHYKHTVKEALFAQFSTPSVSWLILGLVLSATIVGLFLLKKMSKRNQLIYMNFGLFSILIAPVMTLYFSYTLMTENDRYGYMASAFLFMGLALVLSKLPRFIFYGISIIYLCISTFLLLKTNRIWYKSEKIFTQLAKQYLPEGVIEAEASEVLILNVPDNYEGMPMFRVLAEESGVKEAIEIFQDRKLPTRMIDVAQYNMTTPNDGAHVRVDSANQIMVIFNQWGNWWWRAGKGATNYENDLYKIKFDYKGCGNCYQLTFKNSNPRRLLLFQVGNQFKKVDMSLIGVEQR